MITRLEVDGFKSLQGFAVDLEPFTVFIGPNGAGKSNILEALALLSRLASMPIVDAFKQGRGRPGDQFSRHGDQVAQEMRFAVEFLFVASPDDISRFRYELVIERLTRSSGTEHLTVRHDQLRTLQRDEDTWIGAHPKFADDAPEPKAEASPKRERLRVVWRAGELRGSPPGVGLSGVREGSRRFCP